MKTRKRKSDLYEIIIPIGESNEAAEDGLFDDCPICQALRRDINNGDAEEVEIGPTTRSSTT